MIHISEVIEGLEEEFDCASFSSEDHRHTALQGAVGSWCCSLWGCTCTRGRSWSSSASSSATTSATTSTTSMSGWLSLWLLGGCLLGSLLLRGLSAPSCSCDHCCCHCCFW